jgi:hypothetical protein
MLKVKDESKRGDEAHDHDSSQGSTGATAGDGSAGKHEGISSADDGAYAQCTIGTGGAAGGAGDIAVSQANVARDDLAYLVVAIDPVNFKNPYTEALAGVSTVYKSTPPVRQGRARLTRGYPCITATVGNTRIPTTAYAHWFSYTTDFVNEDVEIQRAIDATNQRFACLPRRYVLDSV